MLSSPMCKQVRNHEGEEDKIPRCVILHGQSLSMRIKTPPSRARPNSCSIVVLGYFRTVEGEEASSGDRTPPHLLENPDDLYGEATAR